MGEWPVRTLGSLVTLQRGIDLPAGRRNVGAVPIMGSFGITGYHDEAAVQGPGVTVGRSGASIGVVSYINRDYWPLNTCLYVKDFHGNSPRFSYYLMKVIDLAHYNSGSAQPSLNRNYIHPLPLAFPDRNEQDLIVELLGALDDKIELNRRMNETLEAMARAIFKDWFVDFGPTRAKAEGRAPYLAPEVWDLFPDALDDEAKPIGWLRWTVDDLAVHHRATVSPAAESERLFEHYSIPAYDAGQEPALDIGASIKSNKTVFPSGSVLLSKLNPDIPRVWIPNPQNDLPQVASTELLAFAPKSPGTRGLLYCLFLDAGFRREMEAMVTGTSKSHQRVPPKALVQRQVLSGAANVFENFDRQISPLLDRVLKNRAESSTLAQTRDLLLPKLMSGEIRLREAEKAVEAVA